MFRNLHSVKSEGMVHQSHPLLQHASLAVMIVAAIGVCIAGGEEPSSSPATATSNVNQSAASEPTAAGGQPETSTAATDGPATASADIPADVPRVSLDVARDRGRLMHDLYSTTLDAMHHRYFHGDRAVVPARAMEDVFKEMNRRDHSQSRWISASFSPMSIDHEPKTEFEKSAAARIAKGEELVETIEAGYYRRVGSISLNRGCISCHSGVFASTSPGQKFAGLVISIPVDKSAALPETTAP